MARGRKRWRKNAQASLFILIGVIVLLAVVVVFSFYSTKDHVVPSSTSQQGILTVSADKEQVRQFILHCFDSGTINSILSLGKEGFSDGLPSDYEVVTSYQFTALQNGVGFMESKQDIVVVPVYFNKGVVLIPGEEEIRQALQSRIQKNVNTCIDGFRAFSDLGVVFDKSNISVSVGLEPAVGVGGTGNSGAVTVSLVSPVIATIGKTSMTIDGLRHTLHYPLQEKYGIVREFLDEQAKDTSYMPIGFLTHLASERHFTFETDYMGNGTMVYHVVFDDFTEHAPEPFIYSFIIRYDWGGLA
ncbi:hypothetical protein HYS47_01080 [Candidatus Woesearchaeota archaeon]|nr:hypothetical protein [Candidatus Woesearchaeota archaeon]